MLEFLVHDFESHFTFNHSCNHDTSSSHCVPLKMAAAMAVRPFGKCKENSDRLQSNFFLLNLLSTYETF